MKRVYKYPLQVDDINTLEVPGGYNSKVLSVQVQGNTPCAWILVNPDLPTSPIKLRIAGTGHDIHEEVEFIDSFQMMDGRLVFHAFLIKES